MDRPPPPAPAPPSAPTALLDRRLVIVTGKGGTGKTTIAAALALAASRAGKRVLAAETGPDEDLARLLAPGSPPVGYRGRELLPGLRVMRIDPFEALSEYLGLQIGAPRLVHRMLSNRAFHQLMAASPGWRELITLGKLWHLEQMTDGQGRPSWDLIVVDAPATGHGVAFLNVPSVVASAVRSGPLRRHSQAVEDLLKDPARTLLLPVTLPEELPTRETTELVKRVREEAGIAIDRVVVNCIVPQPFPTGLAELDAALARLSPQLRCGELPSAGALTHCASFLRGRHDLSLAHIDLVGELTGLPLVHLPFLATGVTGPDTLEILSRGLVAAEAYAR